MIDICILNKTINKIELQDLSKHKDKKIWIDITNITKPESETLKEAFNLHPLTAEDLYNSPTRIKVEEFDEYLFCVFYGMTQNKNIELIELDFIIGKNYIISNHKSPIKSFENLKSDNIKLEALFSKGIDFLFHKLLDTEIDNIFPILENIDDRIEKIEEQVTKKPNPKQLSEILKLKRTIVQIKKATFQQREKTGFLAKNNYKPISKKATPYFRDIYDHTIRVSDSVDNYREAISNTFDAYMSAVSNNMNEVMKVLSMIATIALPLTVISGIYGTNFITLPGAGSPYGFWTMMLLMLILSISMIYFFRKRRWF